MPSSTSRPIHSKGHIGILSRSESLYATRRLLEESLRLGWEASVVDPFSVPLIAGCTLLGSRQCSLPKIDLVIPRIGASVTDSALAALRQLILNGTFSLCAPEAVERSRDKFQCAQVLTRHQVPTPPTALFLPSPSGEMPLGKNISELLEAIQGLPAVLKLTRGTQGLGVMVAKTPSEFFSALHTFSAFARPVLVQHFVAESGGRDIRVLVAGGKVVGAMERLPPEEDFRANVHRGGVARPVKLTHHEIQVALSAAEAVGLPVAGVDLMASNSGPTVIEVNSSPGFEALERVTKVNVARHILQCAQKTAGMR